MHGPDVLAVHDDAGHAVGIGPSGQIVERCRGAQRAVLAVQVVGDDEDHRRLPDGGHVEGLMEGADIGGAVTEERERHVRLALHLEGHGRTDRDGQAGAHDGVRADVALAEVDQVHRPTDPARPTGAAAHQLGEGRLRLHPQCQRLTVPAIGVRLDVARPHGGDGTHGDRLLALTEVRGALDLAGHEEFLDLLLEESDAEHRPVPVEATVGLGHRVGHALGSPNECDGHGHRRFRFQFRFRIVPVDVAIVKPP